MAEQTQKHMMTREQRDEAAAATRDAEPTQRSAAHEETLAKTDELLDEIDEALQGLEDTVATKFQQVGGQ